MSFILGFACGAILGSLISWLAYTWMQPIDLEDHGVSLFPLGKKRCKQGDECKEGSAK